MKNGLVKIALFLAIQATLFAASSRIKDLATTATTAANDDYVALDGTTNGTRKILASYLFGAGDLLASNNLSELTASAATARTNLGASTVGSNLFVLTNPSAISFLRFNADNTVTARSAADFRSDLSLVVGTNVQAYDADLTTYAGITPSANIQTLLGAADYSAMRTQLSLVVGTNVQAYDADLTTYAGITPSANIQTFLGAADYAAMRTQLGLVIGTNVQAYDADLTTWAGVTPSANGQSLVAAANYAAMRTLLDLEAGTDFLAYPTGTPSGSKFLRDDNSWQSIPGGGDALTSSPLSQFAATTSSQFAGVISDETGSGAVVLGTSPSFTTNLTLATGATPSTTTAGTIAFDTDAWAASRGSIQVYDGTANIVLVGTLASDAPSNGQVPTWNTGGTITWETPGTGSGNVTNNATLTSGNVTIGGGTTVIGTSNVSWNATNNTLTSPNLAATTNVVVGNITLAGNTLSSSNNVTITSGTNLDINLTPGGTGNVVLGNTTVGNLTATSFSPTNISGATANGQVFIGNVTSGNFVKATLTAGDGVSITNGASSITINATGSGNVTAASTFAADNRLVRSDGTSRGIQGSNIVIDDSDNISAVGSISLAGVTTYTANAMGALEIDTTKGLNTKTISANSTFTFSATPASNTYFSLFVTNSDGAEKTLTIPSSYSIAQASTITTVVIPGSGRLHLTWRYDGSGYVVYGDPVASGAGDLLAANNLSDLANAATARTNLGVAIGTNVQAYDADLTTYAGITPSANVQSLLGAANYAAMRTLLDLEAGTDFLGYPTGTPTGSKFLRDDNSWQTIAGGGDALVANPLSQFAATTSSQLKGVLSDELGSASGKVIFAEGQLDITAAKTFTASNTLTLSGTDGSTLNIGTGGTLGTAAYTASTAYQAADADLTTYAGITPSANIQTFLGAADYAAMRTQLTLVVGTDVQAYDADLTTWAGTTPGTGVTTFLATPSSANLASALTDEEGSSGGFVRATGATLTTATLSGNTTISGTSIITTPAMNTAEIDVTKQVQTRAVSGGNETATLSATPGDETWFSVVYSADGTARTLTLPAGTYWDMANGAAVTSFVIPANGHVHATFRYNSGNTTYYVYGLPSTSGAGVSDGDKGDITVASSGASWTIDNSAVTLAKMADMATASLLGRNTAGTGVPEVLSAATAKTLLSLNNVDNTSNATERAATATLTNKRITPRSGTTASSATPTINTDNVDIFTITALAADVTSFTTNLSGTPTVGQKLTLRILASGANRSLTWGASFASRGVTLPTTAVNGKYLYVGLIWNDVTTTWDCIAVASEV